MPRIEDVPRLAFVFQSRLGNFDLRQYSAIGACSRMGLLMQNETDSRPYVGGQAVLEGVMMRSPRAMAIACRRSDGTIVVREEPWRPLFERRGLGLLRLPFLRGIVVLIESLVNGMSALNFSSHVQSQASPGQSSSTAKTEDRDEPQGASTALTFGISILFAIGLFVALPHVLAFFVGSWSGAGSDLSSVAFHVIDGGFKIAIFVAYIWGIGKIPEIYRVFQYHGAEHKAINAYERNEELTVENARRHTTFHARCGTSFVLFVIVLSIFLFAVALPAMGFASDNVFISHGLAMAVKVPLMLPLSGVAYEINRYAAKNLNAIWVQAIVSPGRLMQRLTTREPTDDQLEIALSAMRAALAFEERTAATTAETNASKASVSPVPTRVLVYHDFSEVKAAMPS